MFEYGFALDTYLEYFIYIKLCKLIWKLASYNIMRDQIDFKNAFIVGNMFFMKY